MKSNSIGRKAVCVVLALLMALSLVACAGNAQNAAAGAQTATGTAKGFGGDVSVTITVEDGKITAASAVGDSETDGVGSVAIAQLPQQMVDSQTLDVDAISGATISSTAVVEAAKAAVSSLGLDPASFTGNGGSAAGEDATYDADVVVVGAGGAGMTAAITAAKAGKSVVVVESMAMVGGNSVRATGGMNAAKTPAQDEIEFSESAGVEKTMASLPDWADNEAITALGE